MIAVTKLQHLSFPLHKKKKKKKKKTQKKKNTEKAHL